jgi:hypothetical protein
MLQLSPEAHPVCFPESNLHNRVSFQFVKNNIIPASPDSLAYGSHPNPDQTFDSFLLIHEPITKYMADRSRLV